MEKRNRGVYDPANPAPFEVSRSKVERFIKCEACFWLECVQGVRFPRTPPFLLNSATDTLLKREFDTYRAMQKPHPVMVHNGLSHFVPFAHAEFERWTQSLHFASEGRLNTSHQASNLLVGGGLDDVWLNTVSGELHIVDYKSTATGANKRVSLDGPYKAGFKRQMELYQWVLRRKGFPVSDTGYFLFVDADQHTPPGMIVGGQVARMEFSTQLLPYQGNYSWIEPTLLQIRDVLDSAQSPEHAETGFGPKGESPCEFGTFLAMAGTACSTTSRRSLSPP